MGTAVKFASVHGIGPGTRLVPSYVSSVRAGSVADENRTIVHNSIGDAGVQFNSDFQQGGRAKA